MRNAILLTAAVVALLAVAVSPPHPLPLGGILVAALAGVVSALLLIRLDDLVDLFRPARP